MIQLIVTDLDNTLLNDHKEVSRYSADILKKCREKGILIAFATARPERATQSMQKSIRPDYVIANNGATISHKGAAIYNKAIEPDILEDLLQKLGTLEDVACITVEAGDCLYTNFSAVPWDNENWNTVYHDFHQPFEKPVPKVSVESGNMQAVRTLIAAWPHLHLYHNSGENWCQIMHEDATKMNAVRRIASLARIPAANTAAFGDDFNDIDMIRCCGIGIAVANATETVRQAADHICAANNEDGVAKWLNGHLLQGLSAVSHSFN